MIFGLLSLILAALDLRTFINVFSSKIQDFSQYYYHWGNIFLAGGNPFIDLFPQGYPPAFLLFITPFSLLPGNVANILWTMLSIISLAVALLILFKDLKPKIKLLLILAAFQLFPVKFTLGLGQINLFVFLGFVLIFHFLSKKQQLGAGITLAIISIMKLNPILFLVYFFLTKNYRAILYCLGFLIITNIGVDLLSPHQLSLSFLQITFDRLSFPPLSYYSQSLPSLFSRLDLPALILPVSVFLFAVTFVYIFKNRKNTLQNFSLFIVTLLLISPIAWQHYLVWTIPAFFYLFSQKPSAKFLIYLFIFFLINGNIKNPVPFAGNQLIFSHAAFGLLFLYYFLLKKEERF